MPNRTFTPSSNQRNERNKRIRFSIVLLVALSTVIVGGCSTADLLTTKKDEPLFDLVRTLDTLIEEENWEEAQVAVNEFNEHYRKRRWKMQLLGELEDYRALELEMKKISLSIDEEDSYESKLNVQEMSVRLYNIYNI